MTTIESNSIIKRFCFIGHIDAGKSSCSGRLYYNCGCVEEHEMEKINKLCAEKNCFSQKYSMLLDIWEEERIKGKTHEFNIVPFVYKDVKYELIDTPGHKTYIRSLIEGITMYQESGVIGCLLISMAKGEFEAGWTKGQTKEDVIIAKASGIDNLIVLLNKMDLVDWNKELFDQTVNIIEPFLKKCKFKSVYYIPISAYNGIGLTDVTGLPIWYANKEKYYGGCLIDALNSMNVTVEVEPIALEKFTSVMATIRIFSLDTDSAIVVSGGFQCVMHYSANEYDMTIEKLLNNKVFIKGNEKADVIMTSTKPIKNVNHNRKFIIRQKNNTIGFGTILKVKM